MNRLRWVLVGLAIVIAVLIWMRRAGPVETTVDLIGRFETAEKRTVLKPEEAFSVIDVTIDGEAKRSIQALPTSRIIWRLTIPDDAWLRTSLALRPEAWDQEGDGALFRIGVSDGRTYEEMLNQLVDPFHVPDDRRWIPIIVDLSAYSGQSVEVIFNTNAGLPDSTDTRNDLAVWGEPMLFVR